jgi:hypothetical protein
MYILIIFLTITIKLKNKMMLKKSKILTLGVMSYICKIITPKNQHHVNKKKKIKNKIMIYYNKMTIDMLKI